MAQFPLVVFLHHGWRSGVEYLRVPGRAGALPPTPDTASVRPGSPNIGSRRHPRPLGRAHSVAKMVSRVTERSAQMSNNYDWWRQALKLAGGEYRELTREQLLLLGPSADTPELGFFRNRPFKDAPLVPVAIWRDASGNTICLQNGQEAEADKVWNYACRNPITEALYHSVLAGGAWPDEPPTVAKEHNLPAKSGDLHTDLTAELTAEKETVEGFLKKAITTQQQADQAGVWAKRLAGIATKADEQFTIEKRPWLDGGNAVDDKWRDLRTDTKDLVKKLKKHGEAWLKELDRQESHSPAGSTRHGRPHQARSRGRAARSRSGQSGC